MLGRLMSEKMVTKFVLKFLDDGSYKLLINSLETNDPSEAFRAAHTIKGICQNLSFDRLYASSNELTEQLRGGDMSRVDPQTLEKFKEDYAVTVENVKDFQAQL